MQGLARSNIPAEWNEHAGTDPSTSSTARSNLAVVRAHLNREREWAAYVYWGS